MATAAMGLWKHGAAAQALPSPTAMDTSNSSTDSSDSATISANDFLSLLVTEMQNQDPTADTDPNEYINQLVNVNSLEQLININQTLSTAMGTGGSTTPTGGVTGPGAASSTSKAASPLSAAAVSSTAAGTSPTAQAFSRGQTPGNLAIPQANPAAQRVALSLNGRHHSS